MNTTPKPNPNLAYFQGRVGQNLSDSISPLGRWLNGTLRTVDHGKISVEFTIREEMTNPVGVLHGGISAAILDDVIGMLVYTLGREFIFTSVNLNCDFLSAARQGDILTAQAEVIRAGRTVVHCEGRIVTQDGKIVAKCASNLIQTAMKLPG